MNHPTPYQEYHPRWIRPRMSTYWWLGSLSYFAFIARELSSIFVAWFVLYLLLLINAVRHGEARYHEFLVWSGTPWILLLNVVSLLFVVFHAVTWFNLAPKAMVVHVGRTRVPGWLIAASNYGAWIVVSLFVAWLLIGT
jgi:succinate dehydrogenase subunit C